VLPERPLSRNMSDQKISAGNQWVAESNACWQRECRIPPRAADQMAPY
jgi:hypothetical protein